MLVWNTAFGRRLQDAMDAADVMGKELAYKIGKSKSVVSRYCSGSRMPPPKTLAAMASALGVSIEYLVHGRCGLFDGDGI